MADDHSGLLTPALAEILQEQAAQVAKWGEQNHPNYDSSRMAGATHDTLARFYGVPTEADGKDVCRSRFEAGRGTWADVLIEEVAEAIAAVAEPSDLRGELVQVAAVAVSWIEAIDRAAAKAAG